MRSIGPIDAGTVFVISAEEVQIVSLLEGKVLENRALAASFSTAIEDLLFISSQYAWTTKEVWLAHVILGVLFAIKI